MIEFIDIKFPCFFSVTTNSKLYKKLVHQPSYSWESITLFIFCLVNDSVKIVTRPTRMKFAEYSKIKTMIIILIKILMVIVQFLYLLLLFVVLFSITTRSKTLHLRKRSVTFSVNDRVALFARQLLLSFWHNKINQSLVIKFDRQVKRVNRKITWDEII